MNRICRIFEQEFDGFVRRNEPAQPFDHSVLKSGTEYPAVTYQKIKTMFDVYAAKIRKYKVQCIYENTDIYDRNAFLNEMQSEFERECLCVCSNETMLNDILIDVFYRRSSTHQYVMGICGSAVTHNLLNRNGRKISFPIQDDDGDIEYGGRRFRMETFVLEDEDEHNYE